MKTQQNQKSNAQQTVQPKAAKQASVDSILNNYQSNVQMKAANEEELLQGKFDTTQLKGAEEDELLQGKFDPAQMKGKEEELLQGKFHTTQLKSAEEDELLQGKFSTAQLKAEEEEPLQKKENDTGLPDNLKSGVENLSGYAMDDVKVHYNSSQPNALNAHAYAQGTDIHVAPGQEKHLPHEAWHVVQQKQGRVQPTMQMKGKVNVNDDAGLENEADVMGAKALQNTTDGNVSLQKKNISSEHIIQHKRMVEVHLADPRESSRIVNDIEIFGNRPDWGSEMDKMRNKGEQLRHEKAWDEIKDDMREELTGSRYGYGYHYSLGEVTDYLNNNGSRAYKTKKSVENSIDVKLENAYRDATNVWSGEKEDNEARGRLLGTMNGYFNKTDMGEEQDMQYGDEYLKIVDQHGFTVPESQYSIKEKDVNNIIFGGFGFGSKEKIKIIKSLTGNSISIHNYSYSSGLSNTWVWRESTHRAYAVDESFNPESLEKLKNGTGIKSSNSYYGDIKIQSPEHLQHLKYLAASDVNPNTNVWSPEATELDMMRVKHVEDSVNEILGRTANNPGKNDKKEIKDYKENIDGILKKFILFRKDFDDYEPMTFSLEYQKVRGLRNLIRKYSS